MTNNEIHSYWQEKFDRDAGKIFFCFVWEISQKEIFQKNFLNLLILIL